MNLILIVIIISFWFLLIYYSLLNIVGILYRNEKRQSKILNHYPDISILIPAYNEGIVLSKTLDAMAKIDYPGKLEIYILNDNSTDETGTIANFYAHNFSFIKHIIVPPGLPKGKSRVLNYGLALSNSKYIMVYDADNQPEPLALRMLVEEAETTKDAVGAVGYVKTINEKSNLLTRMIALEFQVFQLLMQAGRWKLFKMGTLTGTNMLVSRAAIAKVGGYDPYALAEDSELTLRLMSIGGLLPVVPEAVTWEQEPEIFSVWLRQRTRWSQGNVYILMKALKEPSWLKGKALFYIVQQFIVYFGFSLLLLISDTWLILGTLGYITANPLSPLLILWFQCYIVYLLQLLSAQTIDKRLTPTNVFVALIMYFTYAQLFLITLFRGFYFYFKYNKRNNTPIWDKTVRFIQTKDHS